jgi:4-hydroxy-2-oxoglutarate aldolase
MSLGSKRLPPGIYAPSVAFFKQDTEQSLDTELQNKHYQFLASSGIQGIVVQGTIGEAVALTSEEKATVRVERDHTDSPAHQTSESRSQG